MSSKGSAYKEFVANRRENGLGHLTDEELRNEIARRDTTANPFPLDVFHEKVAPMLSAYNKHYDVPSSFLGLTMLCAYSTAIGTAYKAGTNVYEGFYLPVWGCLLGISSSGKSLALTKILDPLRKIQRDMDRERVEKTFLMKDEQKAREPLPVIWTRDVHTATLVRFVLNDNPKGLIKIHDELTEWINGFDSLSKKEGTDNQFWISTWNCEPHSIVRSQRDRVVIPRPFVNVIGGTQYSQLSKLFAKDRDTTGFIFRLLFAKPDVDRIAMPDNYYVMPPELCYAHEDSIKAMVRCLPVENTSDDPKSCIIGPQAITLYDAWCKAHMERINSVADREDRSMEAGILGKIKEYAVRFAGLLTVSDAALDNKCPDPYHFYEAGQIFRNIMSVDEATMRRALRLADYFFVTARETAEYVQRVMTAPPEVLQTAVLMKMGKEYREIAKALYGSDTNAAKQKVARNVKRWLVLYPRVFGSQAR